MPLVIIQIIGLSPSGRFARLESSLGEAGGFDIREEKI